jgi:hypothetical protein
MKVLEQTIAVLAEKVKAETIIAHGNLRLRAIVVSDAYNMQCSANLYVWNPESLTWNPLTDIPYGVMSTPHGLQRSDDGENPEHFQKDIERLYEKAQHVLPVINNPLRTVEDDYVASNGALCPNCKSLEISAEGRPQCDGDEIYLDILCSSCGSQWEDKYVLAGISSPKGFNPADLSPLAQ